MALSDPKIPARQHGGEGHYRAVIHLDHIVEVIEALHQDTLVFSSDARTKNKGKDDMKRKLKIKITSKKRALQ